ncbi:hypothetical protein B5S28_g3548 [[Candida] boidinii]|nr:hypothetical protein B5S28_g3548 [[Candida] boidinii]OWB60799.1 hypothetical protein B5S29_g1681 [[Candida] boidinii]
MKTLLVSVVCNDDGCTTITSTGSDVTTITSLVAYTTTTTVTSCEDKKCHESEITSVITTESELECSGSETLTCEVKSYSTETVTYTSTVPVTVPLTKNDETIDSTSYITTHSESSFTHVTEVESTVIPPAHSTLIPPVQSSADQQQSTIELTTVISTTTTIPPAESSLSSSISSSIETAVSTLEGASNKMYPSFTISLGFLLSIIFFV